MFNEAWQKVTSQPAPADLLPRLRAAYEEPHRAYHNLAHVEDCR